jgi:hypothetical protein
MGSYCPTCPPFVQKITLHFGPGMQTKEVLVQRYREDFDAFGFDRFDPKYGDTSRPNIMSALPS